MREHSLPSPLDEYPHPPDSPAAAGRGEDGRPRVRALLVHRADLERRLDELRAAAIELEAMLECQDSTDSATLLAELRAWALDDARRRTLLAAPW